MWLHVIIITDYWIPHLIIYYYCNRLQSYDKTPNIIFVFVSNSFQFVP